MKPEEQYNRWLDGEGAAPEGSAEEELAQWQKLAPALRAGLSGAECPSPDFVRSQILREIAAPVAPARPERRRIGWLAAWGVGSLAVAAILSFAWSDLLLMDQHPVSTRTSVLEVESSAPGLHAYLVRVGEPADTLVLWLEGLEYIPAEREIN